MDGRRRTAVITALGIIALAIVYGVLAYRRRWICDDGLIVTRTVNQLLAGHGPVFNLGERVEANTSTVWTYLVTVATFVSRQHPAYVQLVVGALLSVGGALVGMNATRRWLRSRGSTSVLVPAGAWTLIGVYPFWDFATSGLETGLCMFWLAASWALLVELPKRPRLAAFVFGLGPLVRPDFGLATLVFLVGAWFLVRPSRRQTLGFVAIAFALPVAYEVFRMGYYGVLVPLPAITKSASAAHWDRGWLYLRDFGRPYMFYIPACALAVTAGVALSRRIALDRRDRVLFAVPMITAALMVVYVTRVGGDFMHARMLLPPLYVFVLPFFVLPLRKLTTPLVAVIAMWAILIGYARGTAQNPSTTINVEDERAGYIRWTSHSHPIDPEVFVAALPTGPLVHVTSYLGVHRLYTEGGFDLPMDPTIDRPVVYGVGHLGAGGAAVPLNGYVADALSLAHPIGAHIRPTQAGIVGHEKALPWSWVRADFGDPAHDDEGSDPAPPSSIRAARHAMQCGDLKELLDSVREPMSPSRFWKNLTGAFRRTRLVIPAAPTEAEAKFCGVYRLSARVYASSSYEREGWAQTNLVDGVLESRGSSLGYSSEVGSEQWLQLRFPWRLCSGVTLYPRTQPSVAAFPIDFTIEAWNGSEWVTKIERTGFPAPTGPESFSWPPMLATRIRIVTTKLPNAGDGPRLQLSEVVVR